MSPPPVVANNPLRCWLGFAAVYVAAYAVLGVYMLFFPGWLEREAGFSADEVSLVLAGQTIARTIAGPFLSHRVDRAGHARAMLIALSIASLGAFALFGVSHALAWCWLAAFAFGSVYSPMYPILDAAAMQSAGASGFSFGRLRMVGSLAFLVVILAVGALLDAHGGALVFPLLVGGLAALVAAALLLAPRRGALVTADTAPAPWWSLLRSRQLLFVFVAAALIQGSHATYYNLSKVHWSHHELSNTVAAVVWAEGILAEIAMFWLAPRFAERLRPTTLMVLGGAAAIVRWCVVGATTSPAWLLATAWLHALTFAGTYLGSLRALERRVPPHQRATAQGLLGAFSSGAGMIVGGLLGGLLYRRFEGFAFFAMAAFAAFGLILVWRVRRHADSASKQPPTSASARPA